MKEYDGTLPLIYRRKLPHVSAVYHILDGKRVVYVGRTNNLWGRFNTGKHHRWNDIQAMDNPKGTVIVAWHVVDKADLASTEREHIARYNPALNVKVRPDHVQEIFNKYEGVNLAEDYAAWSSLQQELTR